MQKSTRLSLILSLMLIFLPACDSGSTPTESQKPQGSQPIEEVGFDLDDTLVFSSPAFNHAFEQDVEPFSDEFWAIVNSSDSQYSCIKTETIDILEKHQKKNREIYVITARESHNPEPAQEFIKNEFGIPEDHLYFEPDGKTERLKELDIDIYYGDSNSDITDAQKADITAKRIQRSPKSSYQDKYDPGKYDEEVLENTASHTCS